MKPKSIINYSAAIFIFCFAVACGEGNNSDRSESYPEDIKEAESENYAEETGDAAATTEAQRTYKDEEGYAEEEAPPGYDKDVDQIFKNEKGQGGIKKIFSSSAAVINPEDTIHKFIRTADIRFRVKDVADATYRVEDITRKFKGFVTYTYLNSHVDRVTNRVISDDSVLQTTFFTVENAITIRVPSSNLDTALKEIAQLVEYLDYRNLSANDVRLQILANKLEKRRLARYNARMSSISDKGNSNYMDDKAYIEENILQKQAQADQSLIEDLTLEDQIEYSTVTLYLYQHQESLHEILPNEENIEDYRPSIGNRMGDSFMDGWYFIEDAIVGLTAAWPLFLILLAIYIVLRKNGYLKRNKNKE